MPSVPNVDSSDDSSDDLVFIGSQGLTRIRREKSKKNEEYKGTSSQNVPSSQRRPRDEDSKGHSSEKTLGKLLYSDSEDDFEISAESRNLPSFSSQKLSLKGEKRNKVPQKKQKTCLSSSGDSVSSSSAKRHRKERFTYQTTSKQSKSSKVAEHQQKVAFSTSGESIRVSQREHVSSSDSSDLEETPYSKNGHGVRPHDTNYSASRKLFSHESINTPMASHSQSKVFDKSRCHKQKKNVLSHVVRKPQSASGVNPEKLELKKKDSGVFSPWISTQTEKKSDKSVRTVAKEIGSKNVISETDSDSDTESILISQRLTFPSVDNHDRNEKHDKSSTKQVKSQAMSKGKLGEESAKKSQMTISKPRAKSSRGASCGHVIAGRSEKELQNVINDSEGESDSESIFHSQMKSHSCSNNQNKGPDQGKGTELSKFSEITCLKEQKVEELNCLSTRTIHTQLERPNVTNNLIQKQSMSPQASLGVGKTPAKSKLSLLSSSTRKFRDANNVSSHVVKTESGSAFHPSLRRSSNSRDSDMLLKLKEKKGFISSLLKNALKEAPKVSSCEEDTFIYVDDEGAGERDKEQAEETLIILDTGDTDNELSDGETQGMASNEKGCSENSDATVLLSEDDKSKKESTKIADLDSRSSSADRKSQKSLSKTWSLDSESTIEYNLPILCDNNNVQIVPSSSSPMGECTSSMQDVCTPVSRKIFSSEICSEIIPFQDKTDSFGTKIGNSPEDLVPSQKDLFQRTPSMPVLSLCPTTLSHSSSVEGETESLSQLMPILTPQKETSLLQKVTEESTLKRGSTMLPSTPVQDRSTMEKNSSIDEKLENDFMKVMATSTPIIQMEAPENVVRHVEVKADVSDQRITGSVKSVEAPMFSQDTFSGSLPIKDDINRILINLDNTDQLLNCDDEEEPKTRDSHKETDTDTLEIDHSDDADTENIETGSDNKDAGSKSSFYEAEDAFICVYDSDDEKLFNTQAVFRTSFEIHESSAAEETSEEDYRMTQENSLWWDNDDSENDSDSNVADSFPPPFLASKERPTDAPMSNSDTCGQNVTLDNEDNLMEIKSSHCGYTLETRYFDEKFIAAYEKALSESRCSASDRNHQSPLSSSLTHNTGCIPPEALNSSDPSSRSAVDIVEAISPSDQDTQIDTEDANDGSDSENPDPYILPTQVVINIDEDKDDNSDFNDDDYLAHSQIDYLSSDEDENYHENEIATFDVKFDDKTFDSEDKEYGVTPEKLNQHPNLKSDNIARAMKMKKQTDEDDQKESSPYLAQTLESNDNPSNLVIETCDDPFSVCTQVGDEHASSSHSPHSFGQFQYATEPECKGKTSSRSMSKTLDKHTSSSTIERDAYEMETQIDLNDDELNAKSISGEYINPYEVDTQIVCSNESMEESGEKEDDEVNRHDESKDNSQEQLGDAQQHNTFDLATQRTVPENMHISRDEGVSENNIVEYMSPTQVDVPIEKKSTFKVPFMFKKNIRDKLKLITEGIFDKMKKYPDVPSTSSKSSNLLVSDPGDCDFRTEKSFAQLPSENEPGNSEKFIEVEGNEPGDKKERKLENDEKEEEFNDMNLDQKDPCRRGNDSPENDAFDLSIQTMAVESSDEDILEDPEEQEIMNDKNDIPSHLQSNDDKLVQSEITDEHLRSHVISEGTYKPSALVPGISGKKNRKGEPDIHRKESIVENINEKYTTERDDNSGASVEDLEATLEYNLENYHDIEEQDMNGERTSHDKESAVHDTPDAAIHSSTLVPRTPNLSNLSSDSSDVGSKRKCDPSSSVDDITKRVKFFASKNVMKGPADSEKEKSNRVNTTGKSETYKRPSGRPAMLIPAHKGNTPKEKGWLSSSEPRTSSKLQQTFDRKPADRPSRKTFVTPKKRQRNSAISQNEQIKKAKMLMQQRLQNGAVSGASGISHWRNNNKADASELKELEDVEMPSTQEMMESGLPILNAQMPIDKKKLEQGVPNLTYLRPANIPDPTHSKNTSRPQCESDNPQKGEEVSSTHVSLKQPKLSDGSCVVQTGHNREDEVQFSKHVEKPTVRNVNPEKKDDCPCEKLSQNLNACKKKERTSFDVKDRTSSTINQSVSNQRSDKSTVKKVCSGKLKNLDRERLPETETSSKKGDDVECSSTVKAQDIVSSSSEGQPSVKGNSTASIQNTVQTPRPVFKKPVGILKDRNLPSTSKNGHAPSKVKIDDSRNDIFYVPPRPQPCDPHSLSMFPRQPQPQAYVPDCPSKNQTPFCSEADFIFKIITWNPGWLPEQDKHEKPPPILGERHTFSLLRTSYDDVLTYQKTSFELLLLEIWAMIHADWKKYSQGETLAALICSRPQQSTEEEQKLGILSFELKVIVNQAKKYLVPSSGDLIILDMKGSFKADPEKMQQYKQFAYVKDVMEVFNNGKNCELFKTMKENFPAVMDSRSRVFNVKICVKYKAFVPSADLLKIQRVSSLITSLRQFQALVNLPKNPVSKALINPVASDQVFFIPDDIADMGLKTLNSEQALAVTRISEAVLKQPKEPRICLLQGPPGTGKSHTILALIHQILFKSGFKARICLAAPSNAAVDEIARRIITFSQKKCSAKKLREINVLRVGLLDRVSEAVKPYHLENKFKEKWKQHLLSMSPKLKEDLTIVKNKIDNLTASLLDSAVSDAQKVSNKTELRRLQLDLRNLEAEVGNKSCNNSDRRRWESIIVEESHVICSTLNSFGSGFIQPLLRYHYGSKMKRQPFNCLIVDEATQAIEMETLIPLQYMMSKVVLVGDQQQLPPTVNSKEARDYRFDRSLFERLHFKFSALPEKNPIMTLKKQYRMHPEILVLPNSYFYQSQLYTEESIIKSRQCALSPYLVFDVQDGQETPDKSGSYSNKVEAAFVSKLCQQIIKRLNANDSFPNRIGIICPYADQKQKIQQCLRQCGLGAIEVNTVDGFQGREKDVIIMSCVRAQGNPQTIGFTGDGKRMNVALTRAKLALYIVGHFRTLSISELWRLLYKDAKNRKLLVPVSSWDGKSRDPFQAVDCKQFSSTKNRK